MRRIYTAFLLLAFVFVSKAQAQQITGNVVGADDGMSLPGVSIVLKGTSTGTSTDFDGNFSINVNSPSDVLVFSFMGMKTQEITVGSRSVINVTLEADASVLEDVVVVGYGTQLRSKVSGAISTVDSKSISELNSVRAEDALQGNAAGVNVIGNASPGAKPTVLIRGIPSYTGTDPLVVIDGVPQTLDDFNAINPSDIESINVLKDAAMSAIYGVKGGNGVIVVKTKSGRKNQKTQFSFDSYYGVQQVAKKMDVLNATEYAAILNEASQNAGLGLVFNDLSQFGRGTDWQNEVIVDAPIYNVNFGARGGSENTTYFLSGGYLAQDGVVGGGDKSYFDRLNLTANFDTDVTEKFKVIVNTSYVNIKGKGLSENNITSVLSNALNFDPTVNPYENGRFGVSNTITQEIKNPLAQIDDTYNYGNTNKVYGKIELQYDLFKDFKLSSRLGYVYTDVYSRNFTPLVWYGDGHNQTNANSDLTPIVSTDPDGNTVSTHNRVSESNTNYFSYTYELFGNYSFKVGDKNNFDLVAGMAMSQNTGKNITANAVDIPYNSWDYAAVSAATGDATSQTSSAWQYVKRNMSYFTRINYDFDSKYLFSFTGRVDGSTSFGENNKFAFFPSGSAAWVVSEEDFFPTDLVNYFKVRASYGSVGNDNINPQFAKISTFPKYTFDGNIITGSTLQTIPNADVRWENQVQYNVGADIRLFNSGISLTADYFVKVVDDLLFNPTLSYYLGEPVYPSANIGKTKSSGLELTLGFNKSVGDDFNFNTSFNFTTAKNEVLEINNGDKFIWGSGYGIPYKLVTRFEEGYSPGYFYGHVTDVIFQNQAEITSAATQTGAQPGDIRFKDLNGDGVIDDDDRTQIGDPFPDFTLGWNLALSYKGFDFNSFVYASVGNDIYRAYERNLNYTNKPSMVLDRWTGEGTSDSEPRVTFIDTNDNIRVSDRYVEDGSFIRVKNMQLGYTFPSNWTKGAGISSVRFYAQVRNAFTLTKYSGYDPEISSGVLDTGIDRGVYPQPRVYSLGVNVKF